MEKQALLAGNVAINPIAKPRPKFRVVKIKKGKFTSGHSVMTYYPGDYMEKEQELSLLIAALREVREPYDGPISVDAICVFALPPSLTKKEREARMKAGWHIIKPDVDNVGKWILDAMNHIRIWSDDCQVADLRIRKRWGNEAGISLLVEAL